MHHPERHARRVAFFGGSFDPPHLGHLAVARAARAALNLDTVLFAPVAAQPLKTNGATVSFDDRLAMTRLAIADQPGFAISLADAPKDAGAPNYTPNYTVDTLEKLRGESGPECALFFLMGADSFFTLRKWHRAAEIPFVAPLIVASRPGQPLEDLKAALPPGFTLEAATDLAPAQTDVEVRAFLLRNESGRRAEFYLLPGLDIRISASDIRRQLSASIQDPACNPDATRQFLPPAVAKYVQAHRLYR